MSYASANRILMVLLSLSVVTLIISFIGLLNVMEIGKLRITGAASTGAGVTNLSLTSSVSIKFVYNRNISDFGTSTIPPSVETWIATNQNNTNATQSTAFNNGSEGNGTNYGAGTYVYPFVVENDGNDNSTCINVSGQNADNFIGGTSQQEVFNTMMVENETGSCGAGAKATGWIPMNTSGGVICLNMSSEATRDEVRVHWQLGIPDDAVGTKSNTITIAAWNTC